MSASVHLPRYLPTWCSVDTCQKPQNLPAHVFRLPRLLPLYGHFDCSRARAAPAGSHAQTCDSRKAVVGGVVFPRQQRAFRCACVCVLRSRSECCAVVCDVHDSSLTATCRARRVVAGKGICCHHMALTPPSTTTEQRAAFVNALICTYLPTYLPSVHDHDCCEATCGAWHAAPLACSYIVIVSHLARTAVLCVTQHTYYLVHAVLATTLEL